MNLFDPRQDVAGQRQQPQREVRKGQTQAAAQKRKQHTLRDELAYEARAVGAEGGADADFLQPAGGPRKQEIGQVDAGDKKHQAGGAQQYQERRTSITYPRFLQRLQVGADALVFRKLPGNSRHDRVQVGMRLWLRDAGLQSPDHAQKVVVVRIEIVFRLPRHRHPGFEVRRRRIKTRGHHPDDLIRFAVQTKSLAGEIGIGVEMAAPEALTDDHYQVRAPLLFFGKEVAAIPWLHSQRGEKVGGDNHYRKALRPVCASEVVVRLVERREAGERVVLLAERAEVGRGSAIVRQALRGRAVEDVHQPSG